MAALSLLLLAAGMVQPGMARWQQCHREPLPQIRLACYEALGSEALRASAPKQISGPEVARSATWQAIWAQEQARLPESAPFLRRSDEASGSEMLTRPAWQGATLAIGCTDSITHLRLRLDVPWAGERVQTLLDDRVDDGAQGWFVRDRGLLLEYGRGLPAIAALKRWLGYRELQLRADSGDEVRVALNGLQAALVPLRQRCRW